MEKPFHRNCRCAMTRLMSFKLHMVLPAARKLQLRIAINWINGLDSKTDPRNRFIRVEFQLNRLEHVCVHRTLTDIFQSFRMASYIILYLFFSKYHIYNNI